MSLVSFDGPEPNYRSAKSPQSPISSHLPSTEDLIAKNFKRQKTDEEKKRDYRVISDPDEIKLPSVNGVIIDKEDDRSAQEQMDDWKSEIRATDELKALADPIQSAILSRIDQLMDKQFASVFRKQHQLETRVSRIEQLLRSGAKANDPYWDFGNPGELKPYGILHYVANKSMAMIYSAVDENSGILRDDGSRRKRRSNW